MRRPRPASDGENSIYISLEFKSKAGSSRSKVPVIKEQHPNGIFGIARVTPVAISKLSTIADVFSRPTAPELEKLISKGPLKVCGDRNMKRQWSLELLVIKNLAEASDHCVVFGCRPMKPPEQYQ